jgi:hypothetical protein
LHFANAADVKLDALVDAKRIGATLRVELPATVTLFTS